MNEYTPTEKYQLENYEELQQLLIKSRRIIVNLISFGKLKEMLLANDYGIEGFGDWAALKATIEDAENLDEQFKKIGNQIGGSTSAQTPTPVGRAGSLPGKAQAGSPNSYPDPTEADLQDPDFEAVWDAIKGWDLSRYLEHPSGLRSYSGATGNDVMHILLALKHSASQLPQQQDGLTANIHIEHYFPKGYNPDDEPWKSIRLHHNTTLEKAKVFERALDEIATKGADVLDGYEAANLATAALARFNDGTGRK
jgi:hypothetical protein